MRVYEKNFIYRVRKINNKLLDERKSEEDIIKYLKSIYSEVNEEEVKNFLTNLFDKGIIKLC